MNWIDLSIVIAYLVGTTLFGCSFFFRKRGSEDGARAFMTGGGSLPTCGFLAILWTAFGQRVFPLPKVFHVNLSLVFATLAIVTVGFALGLLSSRPKTPKGKEKER